MPRFGGQTSEMANYFAEQIFAHLPDALQSLLSDLSILGIVEPALADRIRDADDSALLLDRLQRELPDLVQRTSSPDEMLYRFHPLLSDYAAARLALQPGRANQLHQRAAAWPAALRQRVPPRRAQPRRGGAGELGRRARFPPDPDRPRRRRAARDPSRDPAGADRRAAAPAIAARAAAVQGRPLCRGDRHPRRDRRRRRRRAALARGTRAVRARGGGARRAVRHPYRRRRPRPCRAGAARTGRRHTPAAARHRRQSAADAAPAGAARRCGAIAGRYQPRLWRGRRRAQRQPLSRHPPAADRAGRRALPRGA